ncbi:hypothetical protein E2C01_055246 [Portunus trituberculatus]|uniref:Uncharacterized protein n=1 Tax=Portunus trituberculatus TaxID=210409 RepID=A0A5B7GM85_PORTR|nr:hypothetical protein [Portunus trituberculatus]
MQEWDTEASCCCCCCCQSGTHAGVKTVRSVMRKGRNGNGNGPRRLECAAVRQLGVPQVTN